MPCSIMAWHCTVEAWLSPSLEQRLELVDWAFPRLRPLLKALLLLQMRAGLPQELLGHLCLPPSPLSVLLRVLSSVAALYTILQRS